MLRDPRVICLDRVDSTNTYLRRLAEDGAAEGTVVIADGQTAGRGRMGRGFLSAPGAGIYMSALMRPRCAPEDAARLTAWTAVAVRRALLESCGLAVGIKWVNDMVLGGKKLGGILTELCLDSAGGIGFVVVGIGINVGGGRFPEELKGVATSLLEQTGRRFSRCRIASCLIRELDAVRRDWPGGEAEYLREYRDNCVTLGRRVSFVTGGAESTGTAESIDGAFALTVRRDDGSAATLSSGEVSARGLYGYM